MKFPRWSTPPSSEFTLTTSLPAGAVTRSFIVTLTTNQDIRSPWCGQRMIWTDTYSIRPGTTVSISKGYSSGETPGGIT